MQDFNFNDFNSNDSITPLNPGNTMNIFTNDHLTQIQHKVDHIDIVDHFKDFGEQHPHIITSIDKSGNIDINC